MDLTKTYLDLAKETFALRNYKRMHIACAILAAIVMLPFILSYAFYMLLYGLLVIVYKLAASPADHLLAFVKGEGKEVKHATQAVIYLIGFPFVFFLKALLAILIFVISIVHFLTSIAGYIATLGGITFSPFVVNLVDRNKSEQAPAYATVPVILFLVFGFVFLFNAYIVPYILTSLVDILRQYEAWEFNVFGTILRYDSYELYYKLRETARNLYIGSGFAFSTFVIVYILAFFRRTDKKCICASDATQTVEFCDTNDSNRSL